MSNQECRITVEERPEKWRNLKNYMEDLATSSHGVKGSCIFNDVQNYHKIENPKLDLMHDLPEGVAVYLIEGVLTFLILVFDIIILNEVNDAIKILDYGSLESTNRPEPLKIESCSEDLATGHKKN